MTLVPTLKSRSHTNIRFMAQNDLASVNLNYLHFITEIITELARTLSFLISLILMENTKISNDYIYNIGNFF